MYPDAMLTLALGKRLVSICRLLIGILQFHLKFGMSTVIHLESISKLKQHHNLLYAASPLQHLMALSYDFVIYNAVKSVFQSRLFLNDSTILGQYIDLSTGWAYSSADCAPCPRRHEGHCALYTSFACSSRCFQRRNNITIITLVYSLHRHLLSYQGNLANLN
jgi:hypothetical protein